MLKVALWSSRTLASHLPRRRRFLIVKDLLRQTWLHLSLAKYHGLSLVGCPISVVGSIDEWTEFYEMYAPTLATARVRTIETHAFSNWLTSSLVVELAVPSAPSQKSFRLPGYFRCSPRTNPHAAWEACDLAIMFSPSISTQNASYKVSSQLNRLVDLGLSKTYVFGTGASLSSARAYDWSDGYRVVCNTIVKSQETWNHLLPHVIVAGDALYHFSLTRHARTFRSDLRERLKEHKAVFAYPLRFDAIVRRSFAEFLDCLLPISDGNHRTICASLPGGAGLPIGLGNVLNQLLLPIACSLSKKVYLVGFDGRRATDKLFWSYSNEHAYPELIQEMHSQFPAFFEMQVPVGDKERYIRENHGDELERRLRSAENLGWSFTLCFPSTTSCLQARYNEDALSERLILKPPDVK